MMANISLRKAQTSVAQKSPNQKKAGGSLRRPLGNLLPKRGEAYAPSTSATSIFRPGPIVLETVIFLTYLPFEPLGLALTTA